MKIQPITKTIPKFIDNLLEKDGDQNYEEELRFNAKVLKAAGARPYNQLDELSQALIKSYKQTKQIFQDESKKMYQRNKFIESFFHQKQLDKILPTKRYSTGVFNVIDAEQDYSDFNCLQKKQEYQNGQEPLQSQQKQIIQVQVNIKNYKQIFISLDKKFHLVTKVTVKYQTQALVQKTLKSLANCTNLQELYIQEPLLAQKPILIFFISTFSKLKRLYLNCYNAFDDQCSVEVISHLPNIQKCYWGSNYYKCVGKMAQLRTWREHAKKKRKSSIKNYSLIAMAQQLKNLQNIWISDLSSSSIHELLQELTKMPKLKHIGLGQYNFTLQQSTIDAKMLEKLCRIPSLQSIALINMKINDQQFTSLLLNHKVTLRTLALHNCTGLTDGSIKWIVQNQFTALRQLYLYKLGGRPFKGEFVWDLVQLDTLVIRSCQFSSTLAQQKIAKMKSLVTLDLNGCPWVSDLLMSSVSKFHKTLQYLNLGHSNITFHTREHIMKLTKLKALDIGGTNVNQLDLQKICEANPELKKLSLYGLSGSSVIIGRGVLTKGKMHVLGKLLKSCTHLDVSACDRLDDSSLDQFIKLQYVNVWNSPGISQRTRQVLREQGVVVFDKA